MTFLRQLFARPITHLIILVGATIISFSQTSIHPMDDHFGYQHFIEELALGRVDLSIAGYQGSSFLAFPIYLVTGSELANIYFQILCALLLIPMTFLVVRALFKDQFIAILSAYAMAMMPFLSYLAFRGFTFPSFTFLFLLSIWLFARGSRFTFLVLSFAIIIKPFAVALIPLFLIWKPKGAIRCRWCGRWQAILACIIPAIYVIAQYMQVGQVLAAANQSITATNVFHPFRFPLNAAHGIQMMFSIHNFYFLDPARTHMANMVHTSPLLMVFGVFTLLYPKKFFSDRTLARGMLVSFLVAYALAAFLDHMDNLYMQASVLMLFFASFLFIKKYPLWIPIILATLHFQWLYAYLALKEVFLLGYVFFLVPVVVDVLFVVMFIVNYKKIWEMVRVAFSEENNQNA